MKLHENIHGFAVTACRPLPELNGKLWQIEHVKSGARLVWLDRANDNKTFGIAFRTPPEDDTGVFHILEHSVLCGSERYPVKDPFVELKRSSMNTFLNAMTFPDKTFYPVSSRNWKDFLNLMRVYMDAVLHPLIYSRPEIFWQEGWHYELNDGGDPIYKGVVFNEMKGALASPGALMQNEVNRRLFPDTCYRFESGGNPVHITELTYEQFLDSHRRFYHPSNSYIVLDGELDIEAILSILDSEYLCAYTRQDSQPQLAVQPAVQAEPVCAYYEVSPAEVAQNKALLSWGFVLGDYRSREEQMAVQALADVLCGSNEAPLTRCVLAAGLAQNVHVGLMYGTLQPVVTLTLRNMDENRLDAAKALVFSELRRMAEQGLDHDRLAATLANMEFSYRERSGGMPYGVDFGISILESWLYGGDPAANLEVGDLFASLNRKLADGWFELLLEQVFLKNNHTCQVMLLPSAALGEEKRAEEAARLHAAKAAWSEEEASVLRAQQKSLIAWQTGEDTPEALATIPSLQLSDIAEKPEDLPIQSDTLRDIPLLRHDVPTGGITYVNLYFDITDLSQEELSLASCLTSLLGSLDTEHYNTMELQRLSRLNTGAVGFSIESYGRVNSPEACKIYLCASYSAVEDKLEVATDLITELMLGTRFDDNRRIELLLRQYKTRSEQSIVASGSDYALARISAGYSIEGVVRECCGGIAYFQWLKALEKEFEGRATQLQTDLAHLRDRIFTRGRLTVSVTGTAGCGDVALEKGLLDHLPASTRQTMVSTLKPWGRRNEGIVIPADVSFAVMGGNLLRCGASYSGSTQVMGKIISLTYLWNAIRIQGGAYGAGMGHRQTGNIYLYSYRDPNAARSLACYQQTADALEGFCAAGVDLTGFIIGTVSDTESLLMPRQKGKAADGWYLMGLTYEDRCRMRREMLSTTPDQLAAFIEPLRKLIATGSICVVGSRQQLESCGEKLDEIITL